MNGVVNGPGRDVLTRLVMQEQKLMVKGLLRHFKNNVLGLGVRNALQVGLVEKVTNQLQD
jgi:hypothetical protein